ncbi:hypothetical protein KC909_05940, partial [Candidatus Dojkabacteria bacterium]|nr:hypothetical protein [Candidatus Dojkabacteria bacterium]
EIEDEELMELGIIITGISDSGSRKLQIPDDSLEKYKELIRLKMNKGFWNDIIGTDEIIFIFKLEDEIIEMVLTEDNRLKIAKLCSELNGDPIENTSQIFRYLAGNDFYSGFLRQFYPQEYN